MKRKAVLCQYLVNSVTKFSELKHIYIKPNLSYVQLMRRFHKSQKTGHVSYYSVVTLDLINILIKNANDTDPVAKSPGGFVSLLIFN